MSKKNTTGSHATPPTPPTPPARVVVKFRDRVSIPRDVAPERAIEDLGIGPWKDLLAQYPGLTLAPVFASPAKIRALLRRAAETTPTYKPTEFLNFFSVGIPKGIDPETIASALRGWSSVEVAYVQLPHLPATVNWKNNPNAPGQGYLDPSPTGVDAKYAWQVPGGDGAGIGFADVEHGWDTFHGDLVNQGITVVGLSVAKYAFHGTGVLGIVMAEDNSIFVAGIAPSAGPANCFSAYPNNAADAIIAATAQMSAGDVLLIEVASGGMWGYTDVAVELEPACYAAIKAAWAAGIIVIEPAGNGAHDLDNIHDSSSHYLLNRKSPDFKDSGAIIVGAAHSKAPHGRILA